MINKIPFIGWFLSSIASVSLAVPFYICWTACGIGETYFYFVPQVYHQISFWNCAGLFIVLSILKGLVSFKLISLKQENKQETK